MNGPAASGGPVASSRFKTRWRAVGLGHALRAYAFSLIGSGGWTDNSDADRPADLPVGERSPQSKLSTAVLFCQCANRLFPVEIRLFTALGERACLQRCIGILRGLKWRS